MKLKKFSELMGYNLNVNSNTAILDFFYDEVYLEMENESQPYKFKEAITQRGDGSGDETFWVFEEKKTGKMIFYYIYDGRIEFDEMEECQFVTKYSFQGQY